MKRFLKRLLTFFMIPILAIILFEMFVPETFFTFRVYEGLIFTNDWIPHRGPFYPNRTIYKHTKGDLCPHSTDAEMKKEFWKTDELGFRNDSLIKSPDVIFIGNSFIYGTGLTQKDILTNKIRKYLPDDSRIYNMAPSSIGQFDYFLKKKILNKPKILIYCFIDREPPVGYVPFISGNEDNFLANLKSFFYGGLNSYVDKALRFYSIRYLKGLAQPSQLGIKDSVSQFYFGFGKNFPEPNEMKVHLFVSNLIRAQNYCRSKGIKFYYMFTPAKELVYADKLNIVYKRRVVYEIDSLLKDNGIDGLNTLDVLIHSRKLGYDKLYHSDDTHWNKLGVEVVCHELAKDIRSLINE